MATLDRIEPAYVAWSPSAAGIATDEEEYVGRHRRPAAGRSGRGLSLHRMLYSARHRTR